MADDDSRDEEPTPIEEKRTDSFDLELSERVEIGVTRGETDLEIGPPRDYPDRADVSVRPESDADTDTDTDTDHRVIVSIDAMVGDHGTGHADIALTPAEARTFREYLDETVRWMTEDDNADR